MAEYKFYTGEKDGQMFLDFNIFNNFYYVMRQTDSSGID